MMLAVLSLSTLVPLACSTFVVCLIFFLFILAYIWQCLGLIPASALRDHFWWADVL